MKFKTTLMLILMFALFALSWNAQTPSSVFQTNSAVNARQTAQVSKAITVPVIAADLQSNRQAVAERDAFARQSDRWQSAATSWRTFYEQTANRFAQNVFAFTQRNKETFLNAIKANPQQQPSNEDILQITNFNFENRNRIAGYRQFGLTGFALGQRGGTAAGSIWGNQNTNLNFDFGMGDLAGNRLVSFQF